MFRYLPQSGASPLWPVLFVWVLLNSCCGELKYARILVKLTVISERAKRASSVMFVFNRDFRYVYIYMWPYVNLYAHARISLLRNGLSN